MSDEHVPDEIAAQGAGGPVQAARQWAQLIFTGQLDQAWPLTDFDFRLVLTKSWCKVNSRHPLLKDLDVDTLARDLATAGPGSAYWVFFENTQVDELRNWFGDVNSWGVAGRPRPAGDDIEHVTFVPRADGPAFLEQSTPDAKSYVFAVRSTPTGWLVSGLPTVV